MRRTLFAAALLCLSSASFALLTPGPLAKAEQDKYKEMKAGDESAAESYKATREYLGMCRRVLAKPSIAIELPAKSDDYDDTYLSDAEKQVVRQAVNKNIAAIINGGTVV